LGKARLCLFDRPSRAREVISSTSYQETIFLAEEAIFSKRRRRPEIIAGQHRAVIKQRSSVMSALFNLIYREFWIARLAEMGKHHLGG
jgi:hypothetical protein